MSTVRQMIAIMPDKLRCNGLENELANMRAVITPLQVMPKLQCFSLLSDDLSQVTSLLTDKPSQSNFESSNISLSKDSLVIVGDITPQLASYETKGFEGILWSERRNRDAQINMLKQLEERISKASIPSVFVAMRSPYVLSDKVNKYSAAYATYDYQVVSDSFDSKAFEALLTALFINNDVKGSLPVTID
jgi:beta-N-acetylhexosaminidase